MRRLHHVFSIQFGKCDKLAGMYFLVLVRLKAEQSVVNCMGIVIILLDSISLITFAFDFLPELSGSDIVGDGGLVHAHHVVILRIEQEVAEHVSDVPFLLSGFFLCGSFAYLASHVAKSKLLFENFSHFVNIDSIVSASIVVVVAMFVFFGVFVMIVVGLGIVADS